MKARLCTCIYYPSVVSLSCMCVVCVCVCVCVCVFVRASLYVRTHMYNVALRHSLSDGQRKTANDNYNQHLKAKALRDTYNANIEKAEKEWKGRGQKDRDWILGCLESRAQLSPFISHAYLDMGVWVMAVCNCPLLFTWLLNWSHQTPTPLLS